MCRFPPFRSAIRLLLVSCLALAACAADADLIEAITRVKQSVVMVGTFQRDGSPQFSFLGTGFVVDDGRTVATNAHVVAEAEKRIAGKRAREGTIALVVAITGASPSKPRAWPAHLLSLDKRHDLAVLRVEGGPLPAVALGDSDEVREGQRIAFIGFPLGNALGFVPVTHRGIVSAVTPNILPGGNAQRLNATAIRGLRDGAYNMFQLDGTAYPGNSGGPLFDADSGKVVGIINMVLVKRTKEAMLSHPSGISYAVPANYLRNLLAGSP